MKKQQKWKDFFYFTRSERYGAWILGVLLILSFLLPQSGLLDPAPRTDFSKLEQAVALWQQRQRRAEHQPAGLSTVGEKEKRERSSASPQVQLFAFDPNRATKEELLRLGFSAKLAATLINFRNSGARFYQPEDILKVYGMRKDFFSQLRPYIRIENTKYEKAPQPVAVADNQSGLSPNPGVTLTAPRPPGPSVKPLDVNTATQADWEALPGIGPYYAGRILRFRNALGGFSDIGQIRETYGLPDSTFQKIKPYLQLDTPPQTLAVNEVTAEALSQHPYLSLRQAKIIVKYRDTYGAFENEEQLLKTGVLDEENLRKLRPYLTF